VELMNTTVNHIKNEAMITSLDSFVVGLSPTFWTHIPLLVEHIKNHLQVINGAQCFILDYVDKQRVLDINEMFSSLSSIKTTKKTIPISKCIIVGTIVNAERKSNGCIMYILDDGTGLIDIVHYIDDDFHSLPSLLGQTDFNVANTVFEPGDMVKVFGRIQCVAINQRFGANQQQQTISIPAIGSVESNNTPVLNSSACENTRTFSVITGKSVTREIHASLIIPLVTIANNRSRALSNSIDQEYEHWMNCVRFLLGESSKNNSQCSKAELPLLNNALDVLPALGPDLFTQVLERTSVPSTIGLNDTSDDTLHAWRLFGTQCQCPNSVLKCQLLYCHCIASQPDITIDPNLRFRDALLMKLVEAEAAFTATLPRPKSVEEIWNDIVDEVDVNERRYHFHFQYSSIVGDDEIHQIAREETQKSISTSTTTNRVDGEMVHKLEPACNVQKIIRSTVRALRNDGIIYLVDANTDTYMLMSRIGVLEPHIRTKLAIKKLSVESRARHYEVIPQPAYIKSIPRSRLEYVRRSVVAATIARHHEAKVEEGAVVSKLP
jgi:hypothetical protein